MTGSPMKDLTEQSPIKQIVNKKLPPQRSLNQETTVTSISLEKDAHTEQQLV